LTSDLIHTASRTKPLQVLRRDSLRNCCIRSPDERPQIYDERMSREAIFASQPEI
jgi:hypothetical protein